MRLPVGDQDHLPAEPVQHHPHQAVVTPQAHQPFLSGEHTKVLLGIGCDVEVTSHPLQGQAGHRQLGHLVHPVVAHLLVAVVVSRQIIVFVVPDEPRRGHVVPLSLPAEHPLLLHVVLKILEADASVVGNGGVELVNGIIDALVHGLGPAIHVNLPLELAGLVAAGQGLQLSDQVAAFPLGDKPGGLHRVHQQLELGQLEGPLSQKPPRVLSLAVLHVQAEYPQGLHVVIDALALSLDVPLLQPLDQLGHRHGVVLVGALPQQPAQAEQLELLIGTSGHGSFPLSYG